MRLGGWSCVWLAALCFAFAGVVYAEPEAAEPDTSKTWTADLATELMSPFCPGRTLIDCPSSQAHELIDWIDAQEEAGFSREAVRDEIYAQYGDVILQAPRAEGFGLVAYALPVVSVLAGGVLVFLFLRRQTREAAAAAPAGATPATSDAELERMIDEELRQQDLQ